MSERAGLINAVRAAFPLASDSAIFAGVSATVTEPRIRGIVLLGCRIGRGGRPAGASLRRAQRAAALFHACRPELLVVSGGRRWHDVSEADALAQYLTENGVPPSSQWLDRWSLSTCENAAYSARALRGFGPGEVAVVTCDWHLPRALQAFAAVGVRARGFGVADPRRDRAARALRERLAWYADRVATWGFATPCAY